MPASAHAGTSAHTAAENFVRPAAAVAIIVDAAEAGFDVAIGKYVFGQWASPVSDGRPLAVPPIIGMPAAVIVSAIAFSAVESWMTMPTTPVGDQLVGARRRHPHRCSDRRRATISTGWPLTPPISVLTHSAQALATPSVMP